MLTVFGGVVFYSFLYPLPYAKQIPREQTVSVVNLDQSQASFQLERMVDATPQVKIVQRDHTIADAKQAFLDKKVAGILVIPEHFYKDLLLGKSPTLAYAGDASYFLVYGTIVEGLAKRAVHSQHKPKSVVWSSKVNRWRLPRSISRQPVPT